MRILADENCDSYLVARLRAAGHDVKYVEESLKGWKDNAIFGEAENDLRVLLTNDLDFGLLAERSDRRPPAIVLLRLHPLRAGLRAAITLEFFANIGPEWRGKFFVVEPGTIRERRVLP
jgi:predicted nuclease of predicted toxin-antitoxin system